MKVYQYLPLTRLISLSHRHQLAVIKTKSGPDIFYAKCIQPTLSHRPQLGHL